MHTFVALFFCAARSDLKAMISMPTNRAVTNATNVVSDKMFMNSYTKKIDEFALKLRDIHSIIMGKKYLNNHGA